MHVKSSTVHRNNLGWCAALVSFPGLGTRLVLPLHMVRMDGRNGTSVTLQNRSGVSGLIDSQNVPELVSKMCQN